MSFIRTITGDIAPEELGFTYSHEHIVCCPPHWVEKDEDDLLLDDPEKSLLDVRDLKDCGVKTMIDATCVDYGRDILPVAEIAEKTGMQIVATAGFNKGFLWDARIPGKDITFTEWIDRSSMTELIDFMIRDVEEGIGDTNYRCGQIKFGTGYNSIHPLEEKTIRAACRAHLETKAPMHAHTEAGTMGLEQMEIIKEEGVDPHHISFGHMDRNPDPWMHAKLAGQGAYVCFDGIGKMKYAPECTRIGCILELVRRGFKDRILISGDFARKSYLAHYNYGPGYKYIVKTWIPRFKEEAAEAGYDPDELVERFFVKNPRECFSFKK